MAINPSVVSRSVIVEGFAGSPQIVILRLDPARDGMGRCTGPAGAGTGAPRRRLATASRTVERSLTPPVETIWLNMMKAYFS
ncbi:MAG: hypothetical protein WCR20_00800 [Verrucomicrobiota bacterium]